MKTILEINENVKFVKPENEDDCLIAGQQLKNCLRNKETFCFLYNFNNFYFLMEKEKFKVCIYIDDKDFNMIKPENYYYRSELKGVANSFVKNKYITSIQKLCNYLRLDYKELKNYIYTKEKWEKDKKDREFINAVINSSFEGYESWD